MGRDLERCERPIRPGSNYLSKEGIEKWKEDITEAP